METLTNREREVVALAAHGLSDDEIAGAMVLNPATAKAHVSRAMIKLGARDRTQLVVFAYQAGLVTRAPPGKPPAINLAVPGLGAAHQLARSLVSAWACSRSWFMAKGLVMNWSAPADSAGHRTRPE